MIESEKTVIAKNLEEGVPTISVAKDFSVTPGFRDAATGVSKYPAEKFLKDVFFPFLDNNKHAKTIILDLTGVRGYPPSFLEETFGGAVRDGHYKEIQKIKYYYPNRTHIIKKILEYIDNEKKRMGNEVLT